MPAVRPQSSSISLVVPPTQNTALVLEYRCLFTKDLRQKQKRWQDGRLKLHTFNNRVMVCDERSNNVGDTYWREDHDLEGKELELERGGALVQVGELIGKRDQDLTELVDKRAKEKEDRYVARTASSPARPQSAATPAGSHLRPKALNAIIDTPTGHYGRAVVATTSPFEERQIKNQVGARNDENEDSRPAKRRKQMPSPPSKSGYAQNLFGSSMTLSRPPSSATASFVVTRPSHLQPNIRSIDLTGDEDDSPSGIQSGTRDNPTLLVNKLSRLRAKKTAPPKSTYAGNLTGTSLTLSAPPDSRCITKKAPISKRVMKSAPLLNISDDETDPVELGFSSSSTHAVCTNTVQTKISNPTSKLSKAKPSLSSNLPRKIQATPVATNEVRSTSKNTAPQFTLRIKSRPRKQMMMLMDLPSSTRSSRRPSNQKILPNSGSNSSTYEPSQATARLDSFIQEQEERQQKRLKARHLEESPEEPMSSLLDHGIDHETTDALLTRDSSMPPYTDGINHSMLQNSFEPNKSAASDMGYPNEEVTFYSSLKVPELAIVPVQPKMSSLTGIDLSDKDSRAANTSKAKRRDKNINSINFDVEKLIAVAGAEPGRSSAATRTHNHEAKANEEALRAQLQVSLQKANHERKASERERKAEEKKFVDAARKKAFEEERQKSERAVEEAAHQKSVEQEREKLEQQKLEKDREDEALQNRMDEDRQKAESLRAEIANLEVIKQERIAAQETKIREEQQAEMARREEFARIEHAREIIARQKRAQEEKEADEMRKELAILRREKELAAEQKEIETAQRAEEERERKDGERRRREEIQRRKDEELRRDQMQASKEIEVIQGQDTSTSCSIVIATTPVASKNVLAQASNIILPPHLDNAILSSTDRFRRMIQPQSRPAINTHFDPPTNAKSPTENEITNILPTLEHASKSFGADAQVEPISNSLRNSHGRARSVNGLNTSFEGPPIGNASMTTGVTKAFKLSRPTRVEANKIAESMQPPRRAGCSLSINEPAGNRDVQCTRKPTADGPWSYEAFDLFTWRPPP
ncbi:hypothetical protein PVAG01_09154 [Phlyctema vagabunda]|uniref:5'-3' DNA helicase ZGRF1-like N-terminal domain-containing protein n=1 Tax=Phlyctema vagabunda TaxID=108571 RepID=A0ABR4P6J5_9HELO